MRNSRKFCQRIPFLVYEGSDAPQAIIGPPVKRDLNGVSMAGAMMAQHLLCSFMFYRGSGLVLLRNPIFRDFSEGSGSPVPTSGSAHG